MKVINIYSNPEYETLNNKICKSIIRYVFNSEKTLSYEVNVIFTSDIFVSDLKKKFFLKDEWTDVIAFPLHNNMKEKLYCANKKIGRDVPEAEQYDKKYKCEV